LRRKPHHSGKIFFPKVAAKYSFSHSLERESIVTLRKVGDGGMRKAR